MVLDEELIDVVGSEVVEVEKVDLVCSVVEDDVLVVGSAAIN